MINCCGRPLTEIILFRALTLLEVIGVPVGVTDDLEKIEGVAGNFGVYNEDEEEATDG